MSSRIQGLKVHRLQDKKTLRKMAGLMKSQRKAQELLMKWLERGKK